MNHKRPFRLAILISGRGSNMQAILSACRHRWNHVELVVVASNNPSAPGLAIANSEGIPNFSLEPKEFDDRLSFDMALMTKLDQYQPDLVVLAGYMRILSNAFVEHYKERLVNIHPSLLPMFPGLNTHRHAIESGVKIHGCTVHYVTPALDCGPIIAQAWVPVSSTDTPDSLAEKVLSCEHGLYIKCLDWIVDDLVQLTGQHVIIQGDPKRLYSLDELN